ncbi:MAG: phospholipase D-like domain-containing protein [Thermofilaceae archaeon]
MEIEVASVRRLYRFLLETLPFHTFRIYVHILTEPFISLLAELPVSVKKYSEVFLDGEKRRVNDYAVKRLVSAGYSGVWYVNRLHAKMLIIGSRPSYIVIGSSNLTARSFENYEVIVIIRNPSAEVVDRALRIAHHAETRKYRPEL